MILHFNPSNYLRIEDPRPLDTTASGASFATSTGDILDVTALRSRRVPHAHRPAHATRLRHPRRPREAVHGFAAGHARHELRRGRRACSRSAADRCASGCSGGASRSPARSPTSTFAASRGCRLSAASAKGGEWTASFALASGEPVYGLGEKFGPLDKRGQLIHSQVEDALGVNTGPRVQEHAVRVEPGHRTRRMGRVRAHAGPCRARRRASRLVARSYAIVVDDEALDLFLFAADTPADILDLYTQLTGRAPEVPRWSLGLWVSRAYYKTPEEADRRRAKLRERRIPCDVITLDGRAAWNVAHALRLRVGPGALRESARRRSRSCASITCAFASGSIRTSRSTARCSASCSRRTCC